MNNIITTRVCAYRNLKNYKFLPKLSAKDKEEIVNLLVDNLKGFTLINKSNFTPSCPSQARLLSKCGSNVLVDGKNLSAINLFDKEIIEVIAEDSDLSKSYEAVKNVISQLSNKIELAYSDDYGYLMSDVTKLGSGYRFEAVINLVALDEMNKIDQLKQNLRKLGYVLNETDYDSIYILTGLCNLGYSERQVFEDFTKMVNKLDSLETESAKMLDLTKHDEIVDRVRRSEAILKSAYIINQEELLSHLNTLRLGLDLGIGAVSINKINQVQDLIDNSMEFTSSSQAKELASRVNSILKGE